MQRGLLGCVAAAGVLWMAAAGHAAAAEECDVTPATAMAECLQNSLQAAEAKLDQLYRTALANTPADDRSDRRRSRAQLIKAEDAWATYVRLNCAYVGGLEGGSNSWVSIFATQCLRDEYRKRIAFFEHPPSQG